MLLHHFHIAALRVALLAMFFCHYIAILMFRFEFRFACYADARFDAARYSQKRMVNTVATGIHDQNNAAAACQLFYTLEAAMLPLLALSYCYYVFYACY